MPIINHEPMTIHAEVEIPYIGVMSRVGNTLIKYHCVDTDETSIVIKNISREDPLTYQPSWRDGDDIKVSCHRTGFWAGMTEFRFDGTVMQLAKNTAHMVNRLNIINADLISDDVALTDMELEIPIRVPLGCTLHNFEFCSSGIIPSPVLNHIRAAVLSEGDVDETETSQIDIDLGGQAGVFFQTQGILLQYRSGGITVGIKNVSRREEFHAWQAGDAIEVVRFIGNRICAHVKCEYESTSILADKVGVVLNLSDDTPTRRNFLPLMIFDDTERLPLITRQDDDEVPTITPETSASLLAQWASQNTPNIERIRSGMSESDRQYIRRRFGIPGTPEATTGYSALLSSMASARLNAILESLSGDARGGGDQPVSGGRLPEHERLDEHYEAQEQYDMLDAKLQPQEENEDENKPDYSDTVEVDDLIAQMNGLIEEGDDDADNTG